MARVFVSHGNEADGHLDELRDTAADDGRCDDWTVLKSAKPGDIVLFFFKLPIQAFVAHGIIDGYPQRRSDGEPWKGHYVSPIRSVSVLSPPISLQDVRTRFPAWRWLRTPQSGTEVPSEIAAELLGALGVVEDGERPDSVPVIDDLDYSPPSRIQTTVIRTVRETARARRLKQRYNYACQTCDTRILVPGWRAVAFYVEVHHLRPLGGEHRGADSEDNMLVLCPNCHVKFDLLAIAIHPETRRLCEYNGERVTRGKSLPCIGSHRPSDINLRYHWDRFISETRSTGPQNVRRGE